MADHGRMEDLVAAYALGACAEEEREQVEAHLDGCATCQELAHRLSVTVEALPLAVEPARPSEQLRARILAAAEQAEEADAEELRILSLPVRHERRRRRRRRRRIPLHWAAVVGLAVALAGLGTWNVVLNQALSAPPARYQIVGTGSLAGASGTVTEFRREDAALIDLTGMPQPPAGRVYQLWLIDAAGRPASAGTFTPAADGTARLGVNRPLTGARAVVVTVEDGPAGARAPTQKPELAGQLG